MQFQNTSLSAEMLQAIANQNFTDMTGMSSANQTPVLAKRQHLAFPSLNKLQRMQNPLYMP